MPNQIMVLKPYLYADTWVFDDEATDLVKEPFVMGVPQIINQMVRDIPKAHDGFRMLFSKDPFPGATTFHLMHEEDGGAWYMNEELGKGWLCPAMLLYFPTPPDMIHVACEALK